MPSGWKGCGCRRFLRFNACSLFMEDNLGPGDEKCLGAGGDEDKVVKEWEDGICGECKDREQYKGAKFAEC
ncbi:hypothetical protein PG995_005232 [Apiospora arundinis]